MAQQGFASGGNTMRYAGYAFAIVVGIVAIVGGLIAHQGFAVGGGIGWLIASIINIVAGMNAEVKGEDDSFFAIFNVTWYFWLIDVALIVVGGVIGALVIH
jgi:hypothetical protein